ncbi:MAG TPA: TonB-dependent receptor [Saprospiraceae bacterium]|nr:TonB-dependent receptor [Saprospiraceae bacterium]
MKFPLIIRNVCFLLFILSTSGLFAQNVLRGTVKDSEGEPLISATILVLETGDGVVTDFDGNFELPLRVSLPTTIEFSYTGFASKTIEVTSTEEPLDIVLESSSEMIDEVVVRGRRISEKRQQSALTMETLDNIAIKETPAANFYDGLGALKDVDLTAASLGFKIINTRGFNSTSPVRSLQIIDGVDNQSPGLNFSLGNFLGASELDVNSVDLIVGASSAFYGPNAFNGVISMQTKNPFLQKGLSAMVKVGERNLLETAVRYADVIKDKKGQDRFAYKFNLAYFQANDWVADNFDPVFDTPTGRGNPGGFDAVNIYGDEYQTANDLSNSLSNPGLGIFHRRGYEEIDVVDYDSDNFKAGVALHYRLNPAQDFKSPELILASNFSQGTTVFQGDNRFSLRNIQFFQHRIELKKQDEYFIRAYATHEDAGDSYDPYFTSLLLQERSKTPNEWRSDYINFWSRTAVPQISSLEGYPRPRDFAGRPDEFRAALSAFLDQPNVSELINDLHMQAQEQANAANPISGTESFLEPGTERFQQAFDDITSSISFAEGGTRFFDRSALFHVHGEKMFNDVYEGGAITDLDLRVGGNFRQYYPNSQGSILLDTFGRNIDVNEFGIYGGGTLELNNQVKISASMRLDKHQNFNYLFSPAASIVYSPSENNTLRASFSSAIRNPTLADQFLFYNVGRAILLGNLDGVQNLITIESIGDYLNTLDNNVLEFFDVAPIRPEQVRTVEAGYRTLVGEKLFLDATYYFSFYQNFIGFNFGVDASFDPLTGFPVNLQAYRVAANATDRVTTQGFSVGYNYYFWDKFVLNGNYSWNRLNTATDDPIIPAFNTPEHKFNIGVSSRDIDLNLGFVTLKRFGFNVNYKWIDSFIFEGSPQFTGVIPQYDLLDAQINWKAPKINTTFKLGASNLLNNEAFQTYGGPRIGRLAYFSILYEFEKQ